VARGLCVGHLGRYYRGRPLDPPLGVYGQNHETCLIPGCEKLRQARGWCSKHYKRWQLYGDPHTAARHWHDAGDRVGYVGLHKRLYRQKGPATDHPCADCGAPAQDWSYTGGDPAERLDDRRRSPYSLDPAFYAPRCRCCHRMRDKRAAPSVGSVGMRGFHGRGRLADGSSNSAAPSDVAMGMRAAPGRGRLVEVTSGGGA